MLKLSVMIASLSSIIFPCHAEEYMFLKCSSLLESPARASVIVGWADLQNRNQATQNFDFDLYQRQADALLASCRQTPDLPVRKALVETFREVGDEMPWKTEEITASR